MHGSRRFLPPGVPPTFDHMYPAMPGQHMTPGPVNPTTWAENPQGTLPKQEVPWPQAVWDAGSQILTFGTPDLIDGGEVQILSGTFPTARAVWASPIFDLRPKLEAVTGLSTPGASIVGATGLSITVSYNGGLVHNLYTCEQIANSRSDELKSVGPATAQTQVCGDWTQNAGPTRHTMANMLCTPPLGARFWRVVLVLDRMVATPETGTMYVTAACL